MLLKGENISHGFDYSLFKDLNLEFFPQQTNAILGISGCGKSTLIHILCTLLKPNSGKVYYLGRSLYDLSVDERVKICRLNFGIIFQSHYLFKGFTALENIEIATNLSNQKLDFDLFSRMKIDKVLNQKVSQLSGGQQQRVSIARILSKKPQIIFADEPTGNLDKDTANDVMNIIFDYVNNNNACLIVVTHDINLAKKCNNSFVLENKELRCI